MVKKPYFIFHLLCSKDTTPPQAFLIPQFSPKNVTYNGSQVEVFSWTESTPMPFSLCVDSQLRNPAVPDFFSTYNVLNLSVVPDSNASCSSPWVKYILIIVHLYFQHLVYLFFFFSYFLVLKGTTNNFGNKICRKIHSFGQFISQFS